MKIVATTRILDEADIVEAFVRHAAHYVDHHIMVDNGSRDGTIEILGQLKEEGLPLTVYQNLSVAYTELHFNTFMYGRAVDGHDADWVLCLDADEFIDDRHVDGGLRGALRRFDEAGRPCLDIPMVNYRRALTEDPGETVVPIRLRRRTEPVEVFKVCLSRRLAGPSFRVSGGNHYGCIGKQRVGGAVEPGLVLAHYADRTPYQAAARWVKGWCKVLASGPAVTDSGTSGHYRLPFQILRDSPELLFRDAHFVDASLHLELADDPILYRGGPLRYTSRPDDAMRCLRMMVGYFERLATRLGNVVETSAEAAEMVRGWDVGLSLLIGESGDDVAADVRTMHLHDGPIEDDAMPQAMLAAEPMPSPPNLLARIRPRTAGLLRRLARLVAGRTVEAATDRLTAGGDVCSAFHQAAEALVRAGRPEEADAVLGRAAAAFPEDARTLIAWAMSAHNASRHATAIERWSAAFRVASGDPLCHACLAANLREAGRLDRAALVIDAALVVFPDDIAVVTEGARIAQEQKSWARALELWRRALASPHDHPDWRHGEALAMMRLGRADEAAAALDAALRVFPHSAALERLRADTNSDVLA